MRLQEDFFLRHNITAPLIYYTKNSQVILQVDKRPQIILQIEQKRSGYYAFNYLQPEHDSYKTNKFFRNVNTYTCKYQDYLPYITKLSLKPVEDLDFAILEMFLYCFDTWLSRQNTLFDMLAKTVKPIHRQAYLTEFINKLHLLDKWAYNAYCEHFIQLKINYAQWLVEVKNEHTS